MLQDDSRLENLILASIRRRPGRRAAEIAATIGVDRRQVNAVLHGALRSSVRQDSSYRWWPVDAPARGSSTPLPARSSTPLTRLATYYLACLDHENSGSAAVFASGGFGIDYAELATFPFLIDDPRSAFADEKVRELLHRARKDRRLGAMIGYPVHLAHIRARSGWEGFMVQPLFLWAIDTEPTNPHGAPSLDQRLPQFNFRAIGSLGQGPGSPGSGPGVAEEIAQLTEELGIGVALGEIPEMDELLLRLRDLRPEWPWLEEPDPTDLVTAPPLSEAEEVGIYNRAVLLVAERSPYTRGLEAELKQLQNVDADWQQKSALGTWLARTEPSSTERDDQPLLEVIPLNPEQREAVRHSLSAPLTVITGPPGTGKSQVVTSLLINAAFRNQRVLFASRNNKAVDVVEVRANALGPRPVVLRLGAAEQQKSIASYLLELISASTSPDDQVEYETARTAMTQVRERLGDLTRELEGTIALRNRVDELEQAIEPLRRDFGDALFRKLQPPSANAFLTATDSLLSAMRAADRASQPTLIKLLWPFVGKGRYMAVWDAAEKAREWAYLLDAPLPETPPDTANFAQWKESVATLADRTSQARLVAEYFESLRKLTSARPPEQINREISAENERLADVSTSLWNAWLRLQPARLTPEDRRRLQDYAALLQIIVDSQSAGRLAPRGVLNRFHKLLPEVIDILPCWAVTSLSARGRVPFDAGFFDLLVIDEASQCDIASALPLLFRARRAVIIGDPHQLRHISSLNSNQDAQLMEEHGVFDIGAGWSYSGASLFDRAAAVVDNENVVHLRDHHRSHKDIIEFSNTAFYDGSLRVATRYDKLKLPARDEPAVRWIDVEGRVIRPRNGGAYNRPEAMALVAELERLLVQQKYQGTVGVVTPFRAQANLIDELVKRNTSLSTHLQATDFIVDTAHGFQGDERDVILLSLVVGPGLQQGARSFLNNTSNLFNVAVTRARAALIVVGSLEGVHSSGISYLGRFADYVNGLRESTATPPQPTDLDLGPHYPAVARPEWVSDWERILYSALYDAGLRPIPQYQVEQYTLDFALFVGDRKLDIEVDGERYHRAWDGELSRRDQIRNFRMIELGWDVMRFWVYQIRDDLDGCVARVREWVERTEYAAL